MDRHRFNISRHRARARGAGRRVVGFRPEPGVRRPRPRPLRPASVLVPLVERGAGLNLILTRRAARLKHHPGQVAFPGGKQEPGDATPLDAALREARGGDRAAPRAGRGARRSFDLHETVTRLRRHALRRAGGRRASGRSPDRSEVDEVFEVPLAFALDPANLQVHGRRWQGALAALLRHPLRAALHLGRHRAHAEDARRPDAGPVTRIADAWLAAPPAAGGLRRC